jgi:hypothetical protein
MRFAVLLGMAVLVAACMKKEAPPAADTAAVSSLPPGRSLASMAGIYDVTVMPENNDSVLTTYLLNTTDTTGWLFAFPEKSPVQMRVIDRKGDTLVAEAGPFASSVRNGIQTTTVSRMWLEAGELRGTVDATYAGGAPDSARRYRIEGKRR